jgi:predicted 3-demethylubiquinone-9 3-methyltransferase (glyoxalase superfamily)
MQKIGTCLWFENQAEEAAKFYISVFKNSKIIREIRFPENGSWEKGSLIGMSFEIEGVEIMTLNGNSQYQFNPSVSLFVNCKDQAEVDDLWNKLLDGGKEMQCGWLTDKYGVSWQIVPVELSELMQDKDPVKAARVVNAMMKMIKLDIAELRKAYEGKN